jgi:4-hydroxy 2-oxovalerate aldolase
MAIANSIAALEAGATLLDGTARGFGAGAGNAQLEVLVAVLHKMGYSTNADLLKMLDAAEVAEEYLVEEIPYSNSVNIVSGLAGVFSGFASHVEKAAQQFKVDPRQLFFELGRRKVVAGQEDVVYEIAHQMKAV